MNSGRWASVWAAAATVCLVAWAVLASTGQAADRRQWAALAGYALAALALACLGYGLVSRAPVWLRLVVSVAVPLLVAAVWAGVVAAVDSRLAGSRAEAVTGFAAAVLSLLAVVAGGRAGRLAAVRADDYWAGRRA